MNDNETSLNPAHISSIYRSTREVLVTWSLVRQLGLELGVADLGPSLADTTDDAVIVTTVPAGEERDELISQIDPDGLYEFKVRSNNALTIIQHDVIARMTNRDRYLLVRCYSSKEAADGTKSAVAVVSLNPPGVIIVANHLR